MGNSNSNLSDFYDEVRRLIHNRCPSSNVSIFNNKRKNNRRISFVFIFNLDNKVLKRLLSDVEYSAKLWGLGRVWLHESGGYSYKGKKRICVEAPL